MKIKIRRKAPAKPNYNETGKTPFKIITGNIVKSTGCCGKLKEDLNEILDKLTRSFADVTKKKIAVFLATHGYWKPTCSNKLRIFLLLLQIHRSNSLKPLRNDLTKCFSRFITIYILYLSLLGTNIG